MKLSIRLSLLACVLVTTVSFGQETSEKEEVDLFALSLEELLDIPINSASRKDETVFDAPLSSYTITNAEIQKSGATSIMEALRLAPGVIVREEANGVYDIHIRGFDNMLRTSETYAKSNLATLVMIDNRPVFNHNLGGTFWETLPIDLNDVERIEIVRGPSAPLFGPNAVTGVINIITKRPTEKTYVTANAQYGTAQTMIANATVGSKVSDKLSFAVSGNFQERNRFDKDYYNIATGQFAPIESFVDNSDARFPHPDRSISRWGVNGFLNVKPSDKVSLDLSVGTQSAQTQKIFLSGATYFTTNESSNYYANLAAKIHGLSIRTSYVNGNDNLNISSPPNQYDYSVADATAEYEFAIGKHFTVTPGLSYQNVRFDDSEYAADGPTFLGGRDRDITTTAGYVRADAHITKSLRVIGGIRADKFSVPDDLYFAYELAATYKLNENNIIRAAFTRSNSGSFIATNFINLQVPTPLGVNYVRAGNENMDLFTVQMVELGYRVKLTKTMQLDLDVFHQVADNFYALQLTNVVNVGVLVPIREEFANIPLKGIQNGATLGLNIVPNDKIQFKPFITVQKTESKDMPSSYISPSLDPTVTYSDSDHKNTPSFYGGYYLNAKLLSKLNVNMNGYYYAAHTQYDRDDNGGTNPQGDISGKFLVNLKANWSLTRNVNLFVNARNVLNNRSREFYAADRSAGLYMAGVSLNIN
ncbi:TonB-dependent receptor [Chryseolinea sp. T2]|uniref:TonB-dependent receptor plug domain-containing protein n=1 Tax=Chryseolinea sp. T2 TaxID=3129255 RepID=UPI003077F9D2